MRRGIALLVAGLVVGAMVMWALPSGAHHNKSVKALKKRVKKLEKSVGDLEGFIGTCLLIQGMSAFGDSGNGTFGYRYEDSRGSRLVTAFDYDDTENPELFTVVANPECVVTGSRGVAKFDGARALKPAHR